MSINKKKVLFVISSDLYYRNYLTTDALNKIEKHYNLKIIASQDLNNIEKIKKNRRFISTYIATKKNHLSIQNLLRYRMLANIKKSSSFFMRESRRVNFQYLYITSKLSIKHILINYIKFFAKINKFINFFISIYIIPSWVWNYFAKESKKKIISLNDLRGIVKEISPDIVVWPDSTFIMESYELVNICKEIGIPTYMIVDNWDNVSSKTVLYEKPDYIGVWGEQSKEHAIEIQNFQKENVFVTGSARFDHYYKDMKKELSNHFNFDYILFAGFSLPYDELEALTILDSAICNMNLKIIYRPHPWRQKRSEGCKDLFLQKNYENVILDPQIRDSYYSGIRIQPSVDYYSSLIKNALFVVASPTSFVIESLIFKKNVLLLAYDDKIHYMSPNRCMKYHTHLKELPDTNQVTMCEDITNLKSILLNMLELVLNNDVGKDINKKYTIDYFVHQPDKSYGEQLYLQIKNIINKVSK